MGIREAMRNAGQQHYDDKRAELFGPDDGYTGPRWEYRVMPIKTSAVDTPAILAEMGRRGWELVAVDQTALGGTSVGVGRLVFKRPATP